MFIIELTACRPGECSRKIYNKKKAQAGLEYIILLALLLAALVPIFIYSMDTSSVSIRTIQSREAVQRIAAAVDRLYAMGGGKMEVHVYLPSGVQSFFIQNKTVKLVLRIDEGTGEAIATTMGSITGNLPVTEGYKIIPLEMLQNGTVYIGEGAENVTVLVITLVNPQNMTYLNNNTVPALVSLNKNGRWCGVSADGGANQTMGGSGQVWQLNLGGLSESLHSVMFHCNDSAGVMKNTGTVYFTINFIYYADLCELTADLPYPLDFTHGLNYSANTFGIANTSDCWDWKDRIYGYSSCVTFNSNRVAETGRINTTIGDIGSCTDDSGMGSGAYGIEVNITQDMFSQLQQGKKANLSFLWGFSNHGLTSNDDIWIKARFGDGTVLAGEDFERAKHGSSYKWNGGFGWSAGWTAEGGSYADVITGANYEGQYGLGIKKSGYAKRSLNLSGYSNPVLTFYAQAASGTYESDDNVQFLVSSNGTQWVKAYEWNNTIDDGVWRYYSFNLSQYSNPSSGFWIALDPNTNAHDEYVYVDDIWVTNGSVAWLGSGLDSSSAYKDTTNEVYWTNNPSTTNSNLAYYDLSPYIDRPGRYYLDLGAKIYRWDNGQWGDFYFDNITLVID